MGVLAERRGKGFDQHSSFLDSQTRPEYNNAPLTVGQHNESFNSLSQVSSAASMLESPSVATYHTSDLFDDFDVSDEVLQSFLLPFLDHRDFEMQH